MKQVSISLLIILIGLVSCQKRGKETVSALKLPSRVKLELPAQNSACITGLVVNDSLSTITFKWKAAVNASSYELQLKNLITREIKVQQTSSTELVVGLKNNTPYSWWVVSRTGTSSDTAHSPVWKFYNAGVANISYAPFPADIVAPVQGQTINNTTGKLDLQWRSSDPDNDLVKYNIYMGTNLTSVSLFKSGIAHREGAFTTLQDVPVNAGTTYYWKVESIDSRGNTSNSELVSFRVQ